MRRKWLVLFLLTLALMLGACPADTGNSAGPPQENPDPPTNVAVYLRTWSIPGGSPYWKASMIKGEYLSDIIIAFALINKADGYSLYIPEIASGFKIWDEVAALKKKYPHLKVNVSVGGANETGFSAMASNENLRDAFAANVCDWLKTYNLDGVDIDWEYPVGPPWGNRRPEDRQYYITLLRNVRDALDELGEKTGKRYGLSTAVPASDWFVTDNDVKTAAEIVDGLKLMAYDYYGSWSGSTGHNANLYNNPRRNGDQSTDKAVKAYLNAGVAPEKIMLGIAFYGQAWRNIREGNYENTPGLFQSGSFRGTPGWTEIQGYLKPDSGYTRYWDNAAKAPFLYNGSIWISYTDHEQIQVLSGYIKEQKLGGVFVWEYGHDTGAELLQTLAQYAR